MSRRRRRSRGPFALVLALPLVAIAGIAFVAVTGLPVVTPPAGTRAAAEPPRAPMLGQVPGSVLVAFRPDAAPTAITRLVGKAGARDLGAIRDIGVHVLRVEPGDEDHAIGVLRKARKIVRYAEREGIAAAMGDDPWLPSQLPTGLELIRATDGWRVADPAKAPLIAVLDSGVSMHADLAGEVKSGYDFVAGDADPSDELDHGTLVAGAIAATAGNGVGIAGVCAGCSLLAVRVLDGHGLGAYSTIANGITYAVDHGARVLVLALGGADPSDALVDAVTYATDHGALVIAAAGNDGCECIRYPAAIDGVLTVGAVDADATREPWSDWGRGLDLVAPGTTWGTSRASSTGYAAFGGTSAATALVAGVAALTWAGHPTASPADVVTRLRATAADLGPAGGDTFYGYGLLDMAAALGAAAPVSRIGAEVTPPGMPASVGPDPSLEPSAPPSVTPTEAVPSVAPSTPAPTGPVEERFAGTVGTDERQAKHPIVAGAGIVRAHAELGPGQTATLTLKAADGRTLATAWGTTPALETAVPAGDCTIVIAASAPVDYTIVVVHERG